VTYVANACMPLEWVSCWKRDLRG